jgi:hypothetical protein
LAWRQVDWPLSPKFLTIANFPVRSQIAVFKVYPLSATANRRSADALAFASRPPFEERGDGQGRAVPRRAGNPEAHATTSIASRFRGGARHKDLPVNGLQPAPTSRGERSHDATTPMACSGRTSHGLAETAAPSRLNSEATE